MNRQDLISQAFQICEKKASLMDLRRILAYLEKVDINDIFFNTDQEVNLKIENDFYKLILELKQGKPVSKIVQKKSFWKYDFFVNEHVLDPRYDSETIIEAVLERFDKNENLYILDLCTGSGCLIISLLKEFYNAKGTGIDISPEAIAVAKKNASTLLENNRLNLLVADIGTFSSYEKFDIIITNPPYIPTQDISKLEENVRNYDPLIALDGGENGLKFYHIIHQRYDSFLKDNGYLFMEIGYNQSEEVREIFNNKYDISIKKDINLLNRVIICKKKANFGLNL